MFIRIERRSTCRNFRNFPTSEQAEQRGCGLAERFGIPRNASAAVWCLHIYRFMYGSSDEVATVPLISENSQDDRHDRPGCGWSRLAKTYMALFRLLLIRGSL